MPDLQLPEDSRNKLDSIVGQMHANNESDANIQTVVNDFKTKYSTQVAPQTPETTFSKLKGAIYDPTIGSIGQGARDVMQSGSRLKGIHEIISGAEKTATPLAVAGAITAPEVTLPAMALGTAGQYLGTKIPQMFGVNKDASNVIGDVSGLAAGGLGAKGGPAISEGVGRIPAAFKAGAPNIGAGLGKVAASAAVGAGAHELGLPSEVSGLASLYMGRGGLRQTGKGLAESAKVLFNKGITPKSIGEVKPLKGPSVADLKTSVKNGVITPEQFNARIDAMNDLTPETKALHKANTSAANAPKSSIKFPVNNPKTLSLGQLETAVRAGRMNIEDFTGKVKELGYNEDHANEITEQLKDKMKAEKESETEGESSNKPDFKQMFEEADKRQPRSPLPGEVPENSTTPPQVPGKLVGRTTGKEIPEQRGGYKAGFGIYEVPIDKVIGTEDISGNEGKLNDAKNYAESIKSGSEAPPLWGQVDEEGNVKTQGARRLEAAKQLGQKTVKVAIGQDYQKPGGIGEVSNPSQLHLPFNLGHESFLEVEPPYKPSITDQQIEESQSIARAAKETILARHLANDKEVDLEALGEAKHTPEYLKAIGQEAGLKREPSLRTLVNAIVRAKELRRESEK
jgi:hypothetical protein